MSDECNQYPCIRIGVDHKYKKFAVFIETADGEYIYISADEILKACREIESLKHKHYVEASGEEIDEIAYNVFELLPVEE